MSDNSTGVPEVMTPEGVVADEAKGEYLAGEKGVGFGGGGWRRWVVVCGLGEEI